MTRSWWTWRPSGSPDVRAKVIQAVRVRAGSEIRTVPVGECSTRAGGNPLTEAVRSLGESAPRTTTQAPAWQERGAAKERTAEAPGAVMAVAVPRATQPSGAYDQASGRRASSASSASRSNTTGAVPITGGAWVQRATYVIDSLRRCRTR